MHSTRIQVQHLTRFDYSEPLRYGIQRIYLTPRAEADQRAQHWTIQANGSLTHQVDAYGNRVSMLVAQGPLQHIEISVSGDLVQEGHGRHGLVVDPVDLEGPPVTFFLRSTELTQAPEDLRELACSLLPCETKASGEMVVSSRVAASDVLRLAQAIESRVSYTPGATHVHTTASDAWTRGAGVCQDHAHVMLAACRSVGLPARYVSGYLSGESTASSASHAWVDVWLADHWVSIDVTHICLTEGRWLRMAVGPDYAAVSPTRGVRQGGGEETMSTQVSVRHETV